LFRGNKGGHSILFTLKSAIPLLLYLAGVLTTSLSLLDSPRSEGDGPVMAGRPVGGSSIRQGCHGFRLRASFSVLPNCDQAGCMALFLPAEALGAD
jgi:hypothetical protein